MRARQPMISTAQIELNTCNAYIAHLNDIFTVPTYESKQLLLILEIYRWQLRRKVRSIPLKLDQLATLKTGVRNAENFMVMIDGGSPRAVAEEIAEILRSIILELTKEIVVNEELYPHLKSAFDEERRAYRKMRNDAIEADEDD
jgi:hypothetical protein